MHQITFAKFDSAVKATIDQGVYIHTNVNQILGGMDESLHWLYDKIICNTESKCFILRIEFPMRSLQENLLYWWTNYLNKFWNNLIT